MRARLSIFLLVMAMSAAAPQAQTLTPTQSQAPIAAEPQNPVTPPDLSARCAAPNADIAAPAPLPRLTERILRREPIRILAIGSSSTWGVGASSIRRTYPSQLQSILEGALKGIPAKIINRGVSGEIAQTTADRLRREVVLERPDVVLWQVGTNDAIARVPTEDFEKTVSSTVQWLKESGIDTVLVGLQYTPAYARDESYFGIRESLRRIAAANDILYVRRYDAMQFMAKTNGGADMISGDGLHLNDLGYQCMAEHVAHAVIINIFLRRKDVQKPQGNP